MRTAETMRPTPKSRMPLMLTSVVSWWTPGLRSPSSCAACGMCTSAMRRPRRSAALDDWAERLLELRIVDGQNRPAAKLPHEASEPDGSKRQRQHDVEPADRDARLVKLRRDQPEEIDYADDQDPRRSFPDQARLALHRARQQQHERHREVEHDQADCHEAPARVRAMQGPANLPRQVD